MIKVLLCVLVLMLAGAAAQAHPGVGIVKDSHGNLFYTDTKQVWKITKDGNKSVAVPMTREAFMSPSPGSGLCSKRGMTAPV